MEQQHFGQTPGPEPQGADQECCIYNPYQTSACSGPWELQNGRVYVFVEEGGIANGGHWWVKGRAAYPQAVPVDSTANTSTSVGV